MVSINTILAPYLTPAVSAGSDTAVPAGRKTSFSIPDAGVHTDRYNPGEYWKNRASVKPDDGRERPFSFQQAAKAYGNYAAQEMSGSEPPGRDGGGEEEGGLRSFTSTSGNSQPSVEAEDSAAENEKNDPAAGNTPPTDKDPGNEFLSRGEMARIAALKRIDTEVKSHEMAHLAAAGQYAKGGARFAYEKGPDGVSYAVGGEVSIDTSPEANPEETIAKMRIVRAAALAPADPSPQDRKVAASASMAITQATRQLQELSRQAMGAEHEKSISSGPVAESEQITGEPENTVSSSGNRQNPDNKPASYQTRQYRAAGRIFSEPAGGLVRIAV